MKKALAIILALLLCLSLFAACGSGDSGDGTVAIRIGGIGPLTGGNAQYGVATATDERTANFVAKYQADYGELPNQFAADGYDCMYAIYEACFKIEGIADMDHEALCDALISVFTSSGFSVDGLTGLGMTWQANGEVSKAPMVVEVQNGAYVTK